RGWREYSLKLTTQVRLLTILMNNVGLSAYSRSWNAMIRFIRGTDRDLREYYTASGRGPIKYRGLASIDPYKHSSTHSNTQQIKSIKLSANFPSVE
ncbi:MAG: hypothetical protein AAFX57_13170, partial [Bacteroidota bacterium]